MAARRRTGTRPVRRQPRRVRFRSRRGVKSHGGSVFRAHRGHRKGGSVFRAHAPRALAIRHAKAVRLRQVKLAKYRAAGVHRGFAVRKRAAAFRAAGRKHPAAWVRSRRKAARFRAARRR